MVTIQDLRSTAQNVFYKSWKHLDRMYNGTAAVENIWWFPKKIKARITTWSCNSISGYMLKSSLYTHEAYSLLEEKDIKQTLI